MSQPLTVQASKAAQRKPSGTGGKAKVAAAKPETPFDDSVRKLQPAFAGNTVEWVLKHSTIAPKGEFETTAEYDERLKAFESSLYAFVLDRRGFDYDADAETFYTKIYPGITYVESKIGWYFRAFDIHDTKLSESTYVGSNAFGAKATVTKIRRKVTQIVLDETRSILMHGHDPIEISFKMPREQARLVKPNLRIAYICAPKPEQFDPAELSDVKGATGYRIAEATIDSPTELWTYYVALRADLRAIWVFDYATGEVFGRFLPEGVQLDAPIPLIK